MKPSQEDIQRILAQLAEGPARIKAATEKTSSKRLRRRTDEAPWSVADILAHLRACQDVWGKSIDEFLTIDNPTRRYYSPRSFMRKPKYADAEFGDALADYTQVREALVERLSGLDTAGWARPGTFTGTSARQRDQTVFSFAERTVNHEQPHLDQIERLLG